MKVYLYYYSIPYEGNYGMTVFSTEEKAQAYMEKQKEFLGSNSQYIEEIELDEAENDK